MAISGSPSRRGQHVARYILDLVQQINIAATKRIFSLPALSARQPTEFIPPTARLKARSTRPDTATGLLAIADEVTE